MSSSSLRKIIGKAISPVLAIIRMNSNRTIRAVIEPLETRQMLARLTWSPSSVPGGGGIWDATTPNWINDNNQRVAWNSASNPKAVFSGIGGNVIVASDVTGSGGIEISGSNYNLQSATYETSVGLGGNIWATGANAQIGLRFSGSITVASGGIRFTRDIGAGTSTGYVSLTIAHGANVEFAATQHIDTLALAEDASASVIAGGTHVIVLKHLSFDTSAQLDLRNNSLIWKNGQASDRQSINAQILRGQNDFDSNGLMMWNGPGIVSSTARIDNVSQQTDLYTIGVIQNSDLAVSLGNSYVYSEFQGEQVSRNDVLVKSTLNGDLNLDGVVNATDYGALDQTYLGNRSNVGWASGDTDFDGLITIDDDNRIDAGFLNQPQEPVAYHLDGLALSLTRNQPTTVTVNANSGFVVPAGQQFTWMVRRLGLPGSIVNSTGSSVTFTPTTFGRYAILTNILGLTGNSVVVGPTDAAPSSANAVIAPDGVHGSFTWIDNSTNEDGFAIYRRPANGDWAKIAEVSENRESFSDPETLNAATTYEYQVRAIGTDSSESLGSSAIAWHDRASATLYWEGNDHTLGGPGTWDVTAPSWRIYADGAWHKVAWGTQRVNSVAVFNGIGDEIPIDSSIQGLAGIQIQTSGYTFVSNSNRVLNFESGAGTITLVSGATTTIELPINSDVSFIGGRSILMGTIVSSNGTRHDLKAKLGATIDIRQSQTLGNLVIHTGANVILKSNANIVLDLTGLSIDVDTNARLDLNDETLIIRNGGSAEKHAIQQLILLGHNGADPDFGIFNWDGPGIDSSFTRQSNALRGDNRDAIGMIRVGDVDDLNGSTGLAPTEFAGTTVGVEDVLVRYTFAGDTDLNREITIDDYNNIDGTFLGMTSNLGWISGDFDFSGDVGVTDYNMIDWSLLSQSLPAYAIGGIPQMGTLGRGLDLNVLFRAGVGGTAPSTYEWRITQYEDGAYIPLDSITSSNGVHFVPNQTGRYLVQVIGDGGAAQLAAATFVVDNHSPELSIGALPPSLASANNVMFPVSVFDADGSIQNATIDWGDGVIQEFTGFTDFVNHSYATAGSYEISASVSDGIADPVTATQRVEIGTPVDMSVGSIPLSQSSATIGWMDTNTSGTSYVVRALDPNGFQLAATSLSRTSGTAQSAILTGLDAGVSYKLEVVALADGFPVYKSNATTLTIVPAVDLPNVTITANRNSINESESGDLRKVVYTLTRSGPTDAELQVFLDWSNSTLDLVNGVASIPSMVTIPHGSSQATFSVDLVDDPNAQVTRTLSVTASDQPIYHGVGSAIVSVLDDDLAVLDVPSYIENSSVNDVIYTVPLRLPEPAPGLDVQVLSTSGLKIWLDSARTIPLPANGLISHDGSSLNLTTTNRGGEILHTIFVEGINESAVVNDQHITLLAQDAAGITQIAQGSLATVSVIMPVSGVRAHTVAGGVIHLSWDHPDPLVTSEIDVSVNGTIVESDSIAVGVHTFNFDYANNPSWIAGATVSFAIRARLGSASSPSSQTISLVPAEPPTATFSHTSPVYQGGIASVSFSNQSSNAGTLKYSYDLDGDGVFELADIASASATIPRQLLMGNQRLVSARISDSNGNYTEYSSTISITNVAPTGTIQAEGAVHEGSTTTIQIVGATDVSTEDIAAGFTYSFDLNNDGDFTDIGEVQNSSDSNLIVPEVYLDDGNSTISIRARISDRWGGNTDLTKSISIENISPSATLVLPSTPVVEGSISASVSLVDPFDPSNADTSSGFHYAFDFNDDGVFEITNSTSAIASIPAIFLADGPALLDVHAQILDKDGGVSDFRGEVQIENAAPVPTLDNPSSVPATSTVNIPITLSGTSNDPGNDTTNYEWEVRRNDQLVFGSSGQSLEYVPTQGGNYEIRFSATDKDGVTGTVAATINVQDLPQAPTDVSVVAVNTGVVTVSWSEGSVSATGFSIERRLMTDRDEAFQQVGTVAGNINTFNDTAVTSGEQYVYRVIALAAGNQSSVPSVVSLDVDPLDATTFRIVTHGPIYDGLPYKIDLRGPTTSVEGWSMDWGDGVNEIFDAAPASVEHTYEYTSAQALSAISFSTNPPSSPASLIAVTALISGNLLTNGGPTSLQSSVAVPIMAVAVNRPPQLSVDDNSVSVYEGSLVTVTGRFYDLDANDSVTLTATTGLSGTIATTYTTGSRSGTWKWTGTANQYLAVAQIISVKAQDQAGLSSNPTTFTVAVKDSEPVIAVPYNQYAQVDTNFTIQGVAISDAAFSATGPALTKATIDWGDGSHLIQDQNFALNAKNGSVGALTVYSIPSAITHLYSNAGIYTGTISAIGSGAVIAQTFRVTVGANPATGANSTGPIAQWNMDETVDSLAPKTTTDAQATNEVLKDSAGKFHDALLLNGPQPSTGVIDGGFLFDGVDDQLWVPSLKWQPTAFAVSFWLRTVDVKTNNQVIGAENGWGAFQFQATYGGGIEVGIGESDKIIRPKGTLVLGGFQHVAFSYSGGYGTLYINGQSAASQAMAAPTKDWGGFRVRSVSGGMDDLRIYNRALERDLYKNEPYSVFLYGSRYRAIRQAFNEVYNNVAYEPYYGLMKGADATEDTKRGNDWDQVALLVKKIQASTASGVGISYKFGAVKIGLDDLKAWLNVTSLESAKSLFTAAHIFWQDASVGAVQRLNVMHVKLRVNLQLPDGSASYFELDPSFKRSQFAAHPSWIPGFDLNGYLSQSSSALPVDYYAVTSGATVAGSGNGNQGAIIQNNFARISDLSGLSWADSNQTILVSTDDIKNSNVVLQPTDASQILNKSLWSAERRICYGITVDVTDSAKRLLTNGSLELWLPDVSTQQITLEFSSDVRFNGLGPEDPAKLTARWRIGDQYRSGLYSSTTIALNGSFTMKVLEIAPWFVPTASAKGLSFSFSRFAGQPVTLSLGADQYSDKALSGWQQKLNIENAAVPSSAVYCAGTPQEYKPAIESLQEHLMGLIGATYFQQVIQDGRNAAALTDNTFILPAVGVGIMTGDPMFLKNGQFNSALQIPDSNSERWRLINPIVPGVVGATDENPHSGGITTDNPGLFGQFSNLSPSSMSLGDITRMFSADNSALEHFVIESKLNTPAISTIKGMQWAKQHGITVDTFHGAADWDSAKASLTAIFTPSQLDQIRFVLGKGFTVETPRSKISTGTWSGVVWSQYIEGLAYGQVIMSDTDLYAHGGAVTGSSNLVTSGYAGHQAAMATPAGDPVNTLTGAMTDDETDVTLPDLGLPLEFSRHYDSTSLVDRGLGIGWMYSYADYLTFSPDGNLVTWNTDNGNKLEFRKGYWLGVGPSLPIFTNPDGLFGSLIGEVGGSYRFTDLNGLTHHFVSAGNECRLDWIEDRNKNRIDISRVNNATTGITQMSVVPSYLNESSVRITSGLRLVINIGTNQEIFEVDVCHHFGTAGVSVLPWKYFYTNPHGANSNYLSEAWEPDTENVLGSQLYVRNVMNYEYNFSTAQLDGVTRYPMTRSIRRMHTNGNASQAIPERLVELGRTDYSYYPNGRAFSVTQKKDANDAGTTEYFGYDFFHNSTSHIDQNGNLTTYIQDAQFNTPTPTAEWQFDEGKMSASTVGDMTYPIAYDSGGDARSLVRYGTAFNPLWTTGQSGTALSFNANQALYATQLKNSAILANETVSLWVYADGTSFDSTNLQILLKLDNDWELKIRNDGRIMFSSYSGDTGSVPLLTTNPIGFQGWHQVTVTGEAGVSGNTTLWKLYVDGAAAASTYLSFARANTAPGRLSFGGIPGTMYYKGLMDDVCLYSSTLTATQVRNLYQSTQVVIAPDQTRTTTVSQRGLTQSITDPMNRVEQFRYDSTGHVIGHQTFDGVATWFSYDSSKFYALTSSTDGVPLDPIVGPYPGGVTATWRKTSYVNDGNGNTLSVTDPENNQTSFTYYKTGLVKTITTPKPNATGTDSATVTTTITYAPDTSLVATKQIVGYSTYVVRNQYDSFHHLTSSVDAMGIGNSFVPNILGQNLKVTPSGLSPTSYSYYGDRLDTVTDPFGTKTKYTYDNMGRTVSTQTSSLDGTIISTVTNAYDAFGNLSATFDAIGFGTKYYYDSRNRLTQTVNPDGSYIRTVLDGNSNVLASSVSASDGSTATTFNKYDSNGRLASTTLPNGDISQYSYNSQFGELSAMTAATSAGPLITNYVHDKLGRIVRTWQAFTNSPGVVSNQIAITTTDYDKAGNIIMTGTYDASGQFTIGSTDPSHVGGIVVANGVTSYVFPNPAAFPLNNLSSDKQRITATKYDDLGRPQTVTDAALRSTVTTYDAAGKVLTITTPGSNVTTFVYSTTTGLLTDQYMPDPATGLKVEPTPDSVSQRPIAGSPKTHTEYDIGGRVHSVKDANGHVTTNTYDWRGNKIIVDVEGHASSFVYDFAGRLMQAKDPAGRITRYAYNSVGQTTRVQSEELNTNLSDSNRINTPATQLTRYVYDPSGKVARTVGSDGIRTSTKYDKLGRLIETDVASADGSQVQVTKQSYLHDQLKDVTDPLGRVLRTVYDALGRKVQEYQLFKPDASNAPPGGTPHTDYTYNLFGDLTTAKDMRGQSTDYTYDSLGRKITETGPDPDISVTVNGNNVTTIDGPLNGPVTRYVYNQAGDIQAVIDPLGNLTLGSNPTQAAIDTYRQSHSHSTETQYDHLHRVTKTIGAHINSDATTLSSTDMPITTFTYHPGGQVRTRGDGAGNITTYAYDELDREIKVTNQLGQHRDTHYNTAGKVDLVTDRNGRKFAYTYNNMDEVVSEKWIVTVNSVDSPVSGIFTNYDSSGQTLRTADSNEITTFAYDGLGRDVFEQTRRPGMADVDIHRGFDNANELKIRLLYNNGGWDALNSYAYDSAGRLILARQFQSQNKINGVMQDSDPTRMHEYDGTNLNQGDLIIYPFTPTPSDTTDAAIAPKRVEFFYDSAMDRSGADQAGLITRIKRSPNSLLQSTWDDHTDYIYYSSGDVNAIDHKFGATVLKSAYTYDLLGRVVTDVSSGGQVNTATYTYDANDQLKSATNSNSVFSNESFAFDANGYRTDSQFSTPTSNDNRLNQDATYTYTYDAEGNRTLRTNRTTGAKTSYVYDHHNRLVEVFDSTPNAVNGVDTVSRRVKYTYDNEGRKISRRADSGGDGTLESVENYVFDSSELVLVLNASSVVTQRFFNAGGQRLAEENVVTARAAGTVAWYRTDRQGSVRQTYDSSLATTKSSSTFYSAFGTQQIISGTPGRFGYTGAEMDAMTKLIDLSARWYDPSTQQFVSQDPIGFGGGQNDLYQYVGNNPINMTDLSGMSGQSLSGNTSSVVSLTGGSPWSGYGGLSTPQVSGAQSSLLNYQLDNSFNSFSASAGPSYAYGGGDSYLDKVDALGHAANEAAASAGYNTYTPEGREIQRQIFETGHIYNVPASNMFVATQGIASNVINELTDGMSNAYGLTNSGQFSGESYRTVAGGVIVAGKLAVSAIPGIGEAYMGYEGSNQVYEGYQGGSYGQMFGGAALVAGAGLSVAGGLRASGAGGSVESSMLGREYSVRTPLEFANSSPRVSLTDRILNNDSALAISCFLADTDVLEGNGQFIDIDKIHVGQRVATDSGVANSSDGKTAAADPNATAVDPKTWRMVTIHADHYLADGTDDTWEIQTLQPLAWLAAHGVTVGGLLDLSQVLDLKEMGLPDGLGGRIETIGATPAIETGAGRVVLTTVNHLNSFVFRLKLRDVNGKIDDLGVTGYHRFYDEHDGWQTVSQLRIGDALRTQHGDVQVANIERVQGTRRVYNMTVESDHVYYVGDLTALVHNNCGLPDTYGFAHSASSGKVFPTWQNTWTQFRVRGAVGAGPQDVTRRIPFMENAAGVRQAQMSWIKRRISQGLGRTEISDQMRSSLIDSGHRLGAGSLPKRYESMLDELFGH